MMRRSPKLYVFVTLAVFLAMAGLVQGGEARGAAPHKSGYPRDREQVLQFVETWRQAWQSKDLDTYIGCYAEDFKRGKHDLASYRRYKRGLNKRYERIRVRIEDPEVVWTDNGARVSFHEEYVSDRYRDEGRKTLELIYDDQQWKIHRELWTPEKKARAEQDQKDAQEGGEAEVKSAAVPEIPADKRKKEAGEAGGPQESEGKKEGEPEDKEAAALSAVKRLEKAAEQGDVKAQLDLARMYGRGREGAANEELSFFWFREAARQGNTEAQRQLGKMYAEGIGVKQDQARALYWTKKAGALEGDSSARNDLAVMYLRGEGVDQDLDKAVSWLQKAAEQGDSQAQNNLAVLYIQGRGVEQDMARAAFWSEKAARQGNVEAQTNMGILYSRGKGVEKDMSRAVSWFRKAAEQGSVKAGKILGLLYLEGKGVEKDTEKAMYWFEQAEKREEAEGVRK